LLLGVLVTIAVVAGAASAGSSSLAASHTRACPPPRYPGLGYFTSLQASGVSCSTASRVAIAYYHCRLHGGGIQGRCRGRVDGFSCNELRRAIPTEIDARVTCRRARQQVVHTYQQAT
jgi:hypothetical protein